MRIIFVAVLLSLFQFIAKAQFDTEFWFAAPEVTIGHGDRPIYLRITSASMASDVTISQPANPAFSPINISLLPNTSITVDLTTWIDIIENKPPDQVLNYGLNIIATEPVTAYYESSSNNNPEIFALKGKNALGKEFYVPMQNYLNNMTNYLPLAYSSFDIVATEDNTIINIVPTKDLVGHPAGIPFNVVLQKGQTYCAQSASHLGINKPSGSYVTSNKNIAITIKDDSMNSLPFGSCADLGGDQIIPVRMLGMKYIVVPGFLNAPYDQAFIVATQDTTMVTIDGVFVATINAGESYQHSLNGISASYIETSAPVTVLQLSGFGCEVGASILPSIECSGSSSVTFTRSTVNPLYVTLLVKQGGEGNFLLNGVPGVISAASFSNVPFTGGVWKYAQISFDLALIPTGVSKTISNTSNLFHLGIIHGTSTHGCRFGYFSDFSRYHYNIFDANTEFCEGDSLTLISSEILDATYFWTGPNGFTGNTRQITVDSLTTLSQGYYYVSGIVDGCVIEPDSVYVIVHPDYELVTDAEICEGDVFTWRNNDYATAGTFTESFFSQYGCDSTYVLNLSIFPHTSDTVTLTECTPYFWPENGQTYNASGIYSSVNGCHTRYLDLTAIQSTSNLSTLSVCDTYTWAVDSQTYTSSGLYSYVQGCHTEYLDLTVNQSFVNTTVQTACDSYYWNVTGQIYTSTGVYTEIIGCITEILNLTIISSTFNTTIITECDSYLWPYNGQTYTMSGIYTEIDGCHSEILDLTIIPSTSNTLVISACDSYIWPYNNQVYNASGIYTEVNGCHTEILELTMNFSEYYLTEDSICDGDVYQWMSNSYTTAGTYFVYGLTVDNCLITNELQLSVFPSYEFSFYAAVCDNQLPFEWEGLQLTTSGVYTINYLTSEAVTCDSVLVMNFQVNSTYEIVTNAEICQGDTYFWRGDDYSLSGIYFDSLLTVHGCDSIFRLNLLVHPTYEFVTNAEICQGEIYSWRGADYFVSGIYYDSLLTQYGCDSVYVLDLIVHPKFVFSSNAEICQGEQYLWRGVNYSVSGLYTDSLLTSNSCDSVYILILNVYPVYEFETIAEICNGDSYLWRTNNYYVSGIYYDSLSTANGCDSVYILNLTVHPEYNFNTDAEICNGEVYSWRGLSYDVTGVYADSFQTIYGCDSVYVLNLTVHPVYEIVTDAEICDGDIFNWRSNDYYSTGTYYDSLMSVFGCDSVYVLNLIVNPVYQFVTDAEICDGNVYIWRGQSYTASGVFYDSLQSIYGCDSVYILNLMAHPEYEFITDAYICQGDFYSWRGLNYNVSGVFTDSLQTVHGCDSVYVLNLTVYPVYENVTNAEICESDQYLWQGNTYALSGTYTVNLLSDFGCDSVHVLNLVVHPEYEYITSVEMCEGNIYQWRGNNYFLSGTYYDSLLTLNGCDSIYVLNLTVHPVYELVTTAVICEGDVYTWRGSQYSVSGLYYDSLYTANLCDSIYVLNLTVNPVFEFTTQAEICEGQQFTWNGNVYDSTGTYALNYFTINGCDSIHILHLVVHPSYEFITFAEICDGDVYTWKNNVYSSSGVYYDSLLTNFGCDSLYILNLTVYPVYEFVVNSTICEGEVFYWRGNSYTVSGTYIDSLTTVHSCDSVYVLNLSVEPVYEFITDAEICHGEKYIWRGFEYSSAGTYSINYYTSNYCDSIYTLNLTVHPAPVAGFRTSKNTVSEDDAIIFFTDESVEANSWYWDFGTGNSFDNSNLQHPTFTYPGVGEYIVWQYVENSHGCNDSASASIQVRPVVTLYVPNAFSPNGDGINDKFYLTGRNIDPGFFQMFIYDRWGKLIFSSNDMNFSWDGKVMGSNIVAPAGVYTWIIEYSELDNSTNYLHNKTGIVTLIK